MPLSLQWSLVVFSSILVPGFVVGIHTMVVVTVQGAPQYLLLLLLLLLPKG